MRWSSWSFIVRPSGRPRVEQPLHLEGERAERGLEVLDLYRTWSLECDPVTGECVPSSLRFLHADGSGT